MFCSSCGVAMAANSSFCKNCGVGRNTVEGRRNEQPAGIAPEALVRAIVEVSMGGLAFLIGLLAVMKYAGFPINVIVTLTAVALLLVFAVDAVFVKLLLASRRGSAARGDVAATTGLVSGGAEAPGTRLLEQPPISVTDHTTAALELEPSSRA